MKILAEWVLWLEYGIHLYFGLGPAELAVRKYWIPWMIDVTCYQNLLSSFNNTYMYVGTALVTMLDGSYYRTSILLPNCPFLRVSLYGQ